MKPIEIYLDEDLHRKGIRILQCICNMRRSRLYKCIFTHRSRLLVKKYKIKLELMREFMRSGDFRRFWGIKYEISWLSLSGVVSYPRILYTFISFL